MRGWTETENLASDNHFGPGEGSDLEYASVGRRLIASLLDWVVALVSGIVGSVLVQVSWAFSEPRPFEENLVSGITVWAIPAFWLVVLMTHVALGCMVSSKGDTLGHRLLGLRIVKPDGKRIGRRCSLVRQFSGSLLLTAYVLPMFVLIAVSIYVAQRTNEYMPLTWISEPVNTAGRHWLVWGLVISLLLIAINHVFMHRDSEGKGWHDELAGTVVVKLRNGR